MRRGALKRAIGAIYSASADRIYEPVVVRFGFPLLGGDLNQLAVEQGRRAVEAAAGRPILDMPVGTAYFTVQVAGAHEGLVVGSDIAEGMVRATRRVARAHGTSNLVGVRADAHALPFADGAFGAILCTNGLQVIPDLDASLAELARVLSPSGTLYTSIIAVPLGGALPERAAERLPTMLKSRREVTRAFARAGLEVHSIASNRFALLLEAASGNYPFQGSRRLAAKDTNHPDDAAYDQADDAGDYQHQVTREGGPERDQPDEKS